MAGRPLGAGGRVAVKDAVVADAAEDLDALAGEVVADSDAVVAGVEDKQGHLVVLGKESDEAADLLDGGVGGIGRGCDALHVERC